MTAPMQPSYAERALKKYRRRLWGAALIVATEAGVIALLAGVCATGRGTNLWAYLGGISTSMWACLLRDDWRRLNAARSLVRAVRARVTYEAKRAADADLTFLDEASDLMRWPS